MIDRQPSDDSYHFTPDILERVETVEFLPYSHAFEAVMYKDRIARTASHTMIEAIHLPEELLSNDKFSEELRDLIPSSHAVINHLTVSSTDSADTSSQIELSFQADGLERRIKSLDTGTYIYAATNSDKDMSFHVEESDIALRLLATFVYARQFHTREGTPSIDYRHDERALPRKPHVALAEQLIMTLGNLDGSSTITTTSLVSSDSSTLVATLTEGESPTLSSIQSKLELSYFTPTTIFEETDLHQNVVNANTPFQQGRLENRFAEKRQADTLTLIDPTRDYQEWVTICDEFLRAIETDLETYAHLDE